MLTSAEACVGTFQGRGTSCSPTPCPVNCVVSDWSDWGPCSLPCGGGTQIRTRNIVVAAANGGAACPVLKESRSCNTDPCPVDCVVSDWSAWGPCSLPCGGGTQVRTRNIVTAAASGGAACPALEESRACNTDPCPVTCCNTTTGACSIQAGACDASSTLNAAAACSPNPCPQPVACCSPCGACTVELGACTDGRTPVAGATACSPSTPCPGAVTAYAAPRPVVGTRLGTVAFLRDVISLGSNTQQGIVEFDLAQVPSGATMRSARLEFAGTNATNSPAVLDVLSYVGDGASTVADLNAGTDPQQVTLTFANTTTLDVTSLILARISAGDRYAGFNFRRVSSPGFPVSLSVPVLILDLVVPKVCCAPSSGVCSLIPADQCCPSGTTLLAGAISCSPSPCPTDCIVGDWSDWGPCSLPCGGGVEIRTRSIITAAANGGQACPVLEESRPCNTDPCSIACCDGSGACTIVQAAACPTGSTATPGGAACSPNLCPQPRACCNLSTGACTIAPAGESCPSGTTTRTTSTCVPGLCPQPVVCCARTGACSLLPLEFCEEINGEPLSQGGVSTCTPNNPCPQPVACCNDCGECAVVLGSCPPGTTATGASTCDASTSCISPRYSVGATSPLGLGRLEVEIRYTRGGAIETTFSSVNTGNFSNVFPVPVIGLFVTATAKPAANLRFVEWTPGGPCTPQNTTINADGSATCTYERSCSTIGRVSLQPRFERIESTVRVTVTGPGSVSSTPAGILDCSASGGACQSVFLNARVDLTATPGPGAWFIGWASSFAPTANAGQLTPSPLLEIALPTTPGTVNVTAGFAANAAPVARCRNIVIDARASCPSAFTITPEQVDNGSSDADTPFGDTLTLSLDATGPFPVGVTTVTLTATDSLGLRSSCQATVTVLGQDCNNDTVPDVCECFYDNTPLPPLPPVSPARVDNAQLAHIGSDAPPAPGAARVADDVYFAPATINRITAFRGQMLTSALAGTRKARLDVFEDCNGAPAATPIASFINSAIESETAVDAGLTLVSYVFDLCDPAAGGGGGVTPPPTVDRPAEGLWLEGGKSYWFSLTGLPASANPDDTSVSFWVTGSRSAAMIGRPPHKATGTIAFWPASYDAVAWGAWENLAECCAGCVNMEFSLSGYSCECPFDQFDTAASTVTGLLSGSSSGVNVFRAADNFIIPPGPGGAGGGGCDLRSVCLIEAYIWTTCQTPRGFIEVYANDCGAQGPGALIRSLTNVTATDTLARAVRDGQTFKLYRLRAALPPRSPSLALAAGTYWLSAGATGSGALSERTFFAARRPACGEPGALAGGGGCGINISSAVSRRVLPSPIATPWLPPMAATPPAPATDLAFRVFTAGELYPSLNPGNATPPTPPTTPTSPPTPTCRADVNRSGAVTIDDIFIFLTEWFAGCP